MKSQLTTDVVNESIDRIKQLFNEGNRIVVSFSGGKDSSVILEICSIAAKETGNSPIDVVMRDEEIMFPGTFEYCERLSKRKDINFHWMIAGQPVMNIFNRECPYWWVFDKTIPKEKWVRQPPKNAIWIEEKSIEGMITKKRFPTDKKLITVLGLRTSESLNRKMGLLSSKNFLKKHPNEYGVYYARPIYDWEDKDVWKFLSDYKLDYSDAYNKMYRLGMPANMLRLAPPTMTHAGMQTLVIASRVDPKWFDRVCERLPGCRSVTLFGRHVLQPHRRLGESWEECYKRECITNAPKWIADRSVKVMNSILSAHKNHSSEPFPQINGCSRCGMSGSWKRIAYAMYYGDPFCQKQKYVNYVEPDFFREGAGKWLGKPSF